MKRICLSISVFILLLCYSGLVRAQATLTIQNTASAIIGSTISVNVNASGISDMVAFQFSIAYDNTKLTYLNCSDWSGGATGSQVLINSIPTQGKIAFVYNDAAVNISNGLFFKLNFTVLGCPSTIQWSDSPTPRELSNSIPDIITCTYTNGTIQCNTILPPVINTHPNSFVKCPGESVSFSVSATGTGTLSYQWQKNGVNVTTGSGGTTNTYTLTNLSAADAATSPGYTCLVTNAGGTTPSNAGTLTINPLPAAAGVISGTSNVVQGQSYSYSVGSIQNATSYYWNYTGTGASITGSGNNITISFSSSASSGSLFVKGVNACGDGVVSNPFTITVSGTPPSISTHPQSAVRCVGNTVSFYVIASGQGSLSYQWQKNGVNVTNGTGGNTNTFTIPVIGIADAASSPGYVCVVTNGGGSVVSNAATLTVNALPTVTLGTLTPTCSNSTVYPLTLGLPAGGTYSGPGVSGSNFNASIVGVGTHSITYTYTNQNGCTASASKPLIVNSLPIVTWTNILPDQCADNQALVLSGGLPVGGTYGGPGVVNNIFNPSLNGPGSYTLLYTYTDVNMCMNAASKIINVVANPIIDAGPNVAVPFGTTTTLTANAGSGVSYMWSTGDFTQSITVTALDTTVYYVTATNATGCWAYDSVRVIGLPATQLIASLPTMTSCPGTIIVPLMVENFSGVAAISLKIGYNPNVLTYTGYQNTHPSLSSGMLLINNQNNTVQIAWFSITPVTITEDTLISFLFTAVSGTSSLTFEQQNPGDCQFMDINGTIIPSQFANGTVSIGTCSNVSGVLSYKNAVSTPLSNTVIQLKQNGTLVQQTTTSSSGAYLFENLANGSYTLEPVVTKPWGGVNSGDALLVMKHFVNVTPLSGLNLKAADVDGSTYVNSGDALLIAKRFVNMISSFTVGNWCTEKPVITITGSGNVAQNIRALCYGDVDGSLIPAVKTETGIMLEKESSRSNLVPGNQKLPIRVGQDILAGSFSLVLEIPENMKVKMVSCPSESPILFQQNGNELSIFWYSLSPMYLKNGDALFQIEYNINPGLNHECILKLKPGSILTDENANPIMDVKLTYSDIATSGLMLYPNPARDQITLELPVLNTEIQQIRIFNSNGLMVYETFSIPDLTTPNLILDVKNQPGGLYEIQLIQNNGITHRAKFILLP